MNDQQNTDQQNTDQQNVDALLAEMDAEFGELTESGFGLSDMDDPALQEFEAELAGFAELGGDFDSLSFDAMTADEPLEAQADMQFISGFIKRKVLKLLKKIVRIVRAKGPALASCVPLVTKAIQLFKRGKYFSALRYAKKAYDCIKKAL